MMEASNNSVNPQYYGTMHNFGHVLIGFSHDPDFRYKARIMCAGVDNFDIRSLFNYKFGLYIQEEISVMGSTNTACRDTVFWRWHTNVNIMLERHKSFLTPYKASDVNFTNILETWS